MWNMHFSNCQAFVFLIDGNRVDKNLGTILFLLLFLLLFIVCSPFYVVKYGN